MLRRNVVHRIDGGFDVLQRLLYLAGGAGCGPSPGDLVQAISACRSTCQRPLAADGIDPVQGPAGDENSSWRAALHLTLHDRDALAVPEAVDRASDLLPNLDEVAAIAAQCP